MTKWYKLKREDNFEENWSYISCDGCGEDIRKGDWFEIAISNDRKTKDCCSTKCVGTFMSKYITSNKLNNKPIFHITTETMK